MLAIFSSVGTNGRASATLPSSRAGATTEAGSTDGEGAAATTMALAGALGLGPAPGGARSEQAATARASSAPVVVRLSGIRRGAHVSRRAARGFVVFGAWCAGGRWRRGVLLCLTLGAR